MCVRARVCACVCARVRARLHVPWRRDGAVPVPPARAPSLTTPPQKQPLRAERTRVLPWAPGLSF